LIPNSCDSSIDDVGVVKGMYMSKNFHVLLRALLVFTCERRPEAICSRINTGP
jgi:hypothetical protein